VPACATAVPSGREPATFGSGDLFGRETAGSAGSEAASVSAVAPAAPGLFADPTTDATIAASARDPGFPLLVPTELANNSSLAPVEGVRRYRIQARGAGSWPAVNLSFQLGAAGLGQYWDVMETTMPSPPLFAQATDSVTVGGRAYEIVTDGSGVRDVAFRRRGTWYWVNNTINDGLTSAQMLGIAEHLT